MIEVSGSEDSPEYSAAAQLRRALVEIWPAIETSSEDWLRITTNQKIYGYDVQDFDIIICGVFRSGCVFQPLRPIKTAPNDFLARRDVVARSFVWAVEVKGHDHRGVRFEGSSAFVRYHRQANKGWHDASDQSLKQAHALRSYLSDWGVSARVTNLVLFPNFEEGDFPPRPHNLVHGQAGARAILTIAAEVTKPWMPDESRNAVVSAFKAEQASRLLAAPFFTRLEPSSIDRSRMDRIAKRAGLRDEWLDALGTKQIVIRGRGGTGKTVILLQLAHRAFEQKGARTLILTYNLALAADMRRIMALLGLPSGSEDGGVRVDSVMSFVGRLLRAFGAIDDTRDFLDQYSEACASLATTLSSAKFPCSEISELLEGEPERFSFDIVMVDEAQDWPTDEIAILRSCFPIGSFVIADGVDQLVRGARVAWTAGVPAAQQQVSTLQTCLRLKSNLAVFANALSKALGLHEWIIEANDKAHGGRVIVIDGDLRYATKTHRQLVTENEEAGNAPIDILYAVPTSWAVAVPGKQMSLVADWLQSQHIDAWDGARLDVRKDIPRNVSQVRVVQYESCRGLEGWTVICLGFDEFYESHRARARAGDLDPALSLEAMVDRAAGRWAMIPLTRAMDTLVLQITDKSPRMRESLRQLQRAMPDVIQWIHSATTNDSQS